MKKLPKHICVLDRTRNEVVADFEVIENIPPELIVRVSVYAVSVGCSLEDLLFLHVIKDDSLLGFKLDCLKVMEEMKRTRLGGIRISKREREVLDGILGGKGNKEIADDIHISERTVKFHVSSLLAKYKVNGRTELAHLIMLNRQEQTIESAGILTRPQGRESKEVM